MRKPKEKRNDKPEEVKKETAPIEKEGVEALKDLNINFDNINGSAAPGGEGSAAGDPSKPEPGPSITTQQEIEQLADTVIGMADSLCTGKGLTPLNPVQKIILRTGLIGTAMKYNISLDKYPEAMLIGGGIWIIADKTLEYKNLNPIKEEDPARKPAEEPKPADPNNPETFDQGRG